MKNEILKYQSENASHTGYISYDQAVLTPRPAVIVVPAWRGLDLFAKKKAESLAELGYVGFAADIYGEGRTTTTNEESLSLMTPLFINRQELRNRIVAAYKAIKSHPFVDKRHIGGIGFCFGGTTIIELLRSGEPVQGVVSFHGTLARRLGETPVQLTPLADEITGSVLALHGHDDPMVSSEDLAYFEKEFTDAGVDWQLHIFGHTTHAFTNPEADEPEIGLKFNPKSNNRAWSMMKAFFKEVFV